MLFVNKNNKKLLTKTISYTNWHFDQESASTGAQQVARVASLFSGQRMSRFPKMENDKGL